MYLEISCLILFKIFRELDANFRCELVLYCNHPSDCSCHFFYLLQLVFQTDFTSVFLSSESRITHKQGKKINCRSPYSFCKEKEKGGGGCCRYKPPGIPQIHLANPFRDSNPCSQVPATLCVPEHVLEVGQPTQHCLPRIPQKCGINKCFLRAGIYYIGVYVLCCGLEMQLVLGAGI